MKYTPFLFLLILFGCGRKQAPIDLAYHAANPSYYHVTLEIDGKKVPIKDEKLIIRIGREVRKYQLDSTGRCVALPSRYIMGKKPPKMSIQLVSKRVDVTYPIDNFDCVKSPTWYGIGHTKNIYKLIQQGKERPQDYEHTVFFNQILNNKELLDYTEQRSHVFEKNWCSYLCMSSENTIDFRMLAYLRK
jgi:hypothetical protein